MNEYSKNFFRIKLKKLKNMINQFMVFFFLTFKKLKVHGINNIHVSE